MQHSDQAGKLLQHAHFALVMGVLCEELRWDPDNTASPHSEDLAVTEHLVDTGNRDMQILRDVWQRKDFVSLWHDIVADGKRTHIVTVAPRGE